MKVLGSFHSVVEDNSLTLNHPRLCAPRKPHLTSIGIAILAALMLLAGCSSSDSSSTADNTSNTSDYSDDHFEGDADNDSTLTDEAGNELSVGKNIELPANWPSAVPTPQGSLIAVSIIDSATALGTWEIDGDVYSAQELFKNELEARGFSSSAAPELSADAIVVFTAQGQGLDITVSATLGEKNSDPGQITVLVNPGIN